MEILYPIVYGAQLAYAGWKVAIILGGLALFVSGVRKSRKLLIYGGLAMAVSPFALFYFQRFAADTAVDRRLNEIAALERHPLPRDHPRTLIVEGSVVDGGAIHALLIIGQFDEVIMQDRSPREKVLFDPQPSGFCLDAARRALVAFRDRNDWHAFQSCVSKVERLKSPTGDAVFVRDKQFSHFAQRGGWSGGALEISMRVNGKEFLLDFVEVPLVKRPKGNFSLFNEPTEKYRPIDMRSKILGVLAPPPLGLQV